jgi:hypothetical protein
MTTVMVRREAYFAGNAIRELVVFMTTSASSVAPSDTSVEISGANRGVEIKAKLVSLGRQAADVILTSGLLLREYRSGGYFREDGFKTFDEAIEAWKDSGQVDFGARQARHLVAIVDMVEALNIGPAEVGKIGMSKLREIASLKDPKDQLALLGKADQVSVGDIQREAKAIRDKAAGRDTDPLDPITLLMTETQKTFYSECIEHGRLLSGLDKDKVPDVAVLVDVILADWMSGAAQVEEKKND